MVLAFLPAAAAAIVSAAAMVLSLVLLAADFSSAALLCSLLMLAAFVLYVYSNSAANSLYRNRMLLCGEDFERWYAEQEKISRRCFGGSKVTVLLNMVYGCCAYDRTEKASELLLRVKPLVTKSGSTYYYLIYLMQVLTLEEKTGRTGDLPEIFSEMQQCLGAPGLGRRNALGMYRECEYARLEAELYGCDRDTLVTEKRSLVEELNRAAISGAEETSGLSAGIGYSRLACCYSVILTYYLLGKEPEAEKYIQYIIRYGRSFPLAERVRRFCETKDVSVLLESIP